MSKKKESALNPEDMLLGEEEDVGEEDDKEDDATFMAIVAVGEK